VAAQPGPRVIDLFCGAGGLSYGLRAAGFSVLVGADHDREALNTHRANVGGLAYGDDLSDSDRFLAKVRAWGVEQVDLIAAGLPCQPFSQAGRSKIRSLVTQGIRRLDDPRVRMWESFLTIVRALHPRAVLVENVPELAVWQDGSLILELCDALHALGYRTEARVLRAVDFGVPQHRRRLFIVGVKAGVSFDWPAATSRDTSLLTAIGDLPRADPSQRDDTIPYAGRPRTAYQRLMRRGLRGQPGRVIHDHITRAVRKDDAKAFRLMPEGGVYKDLPKRLRRYRSDIFHDKYKRLSWNEPSRAITAHLAKDGYWYIHPGQHRTLSVREAARIQSFPGPVSFLRHADAPVPADWQCGPPASRRGTRTTTVRGLGPPEHRSQAS
jgi:DNA (cytosine-5)-methyltransferase 1